MIPAEIRVQLEKAVESAREQGLPQSEARFADILAKIDNVKTDDVNGAPILLDAVDALRDIEPALEAFKDEGIRHVLLSVSAKATELADAIEHKPERERQERAEESRRLKEAALARVRARANKD